MKVKLLCSLALLFLAACHQPSPVDEEKDSLEITASPDNDNRLDSSLAADTSLKVSPSQNSRHGGKHPVTLQWISWENPGEVVIEPLSSDWYSIHGGQQNKDGEYLSIDGKIRRLSGKELEFDGNIVTMVKGSNGGQPCIKKGIQRFYGKGNRKYYRLQNMTNCEGGMLVDYVDIYPGESSL